MTRLLCFLSIFILLACSDETGLPKITASTSIEKLLELKLIKDINFEKCIRYSPFGNETIADVKRLNCQNMGITEIEGVQYLTFLNELWLDRNPLSDITPLANMDSLVLLSIEQTKVLNIEVLSTVINLNELHLGETNIGSFDGLFGNEKLNKLYLSGYLQMFCSEYYDLINTASFSIVPAGLSRKDQIDCAGSLTNRSYNQFHNMLNKVKSKAYFSQEDYDYFIQYQYEMELSKALKGGVLLSQAIESLAESKEEQELAKIRLFESWKKVESSMESKGILSIPEYGQVIELDNFCDALKQKELCESSDINVYLLEYLEAYGNWRRAGGESDELLSIKTINGLLNDNETHIGFPSSCMSPHCFVDVIRIKTNLLVELVAQVELINFLSSEVITDKFTSQISEPVVVSEGGWKILYSSRSLSNFEAVKFDISRVPVSKKNVGPGYHYVAIATAENFEYPGIWFAHNRDEYDYILTWVTLDESGNVLAGDYMAANLKTSGKIKLVLLENGGGNFNFSPKQNNRNPIFGFLTRNKGVYRINSFKH